MHTTGSGLFPVITASGQPRVSRLYLSYSDIFPDTTKHADVSTELKAVIDRAGMVAMANGSMFRRKVGAAVVAVRRGGAVHVFDSINHFFFISQMVAPGSSYWNFGFGLEKGDANNDEEGVKTMRVLGENMAWLMKKIHA